MTTIDDPRIQDQAAALGEKVDQPAGDTLRRELLAELAVEVQHDDVTFPVRTRPGWAVTYSTDLDADYVNEWVKACRRPDGIDQFQLSLVTLAGMCRGLVRNGQPLLDQGQPVTFAHPEILTLYGALDAPGAVRAFYGDDPLVGTTYMSLLEATGSGERLDPTTGSSA